MYFFIFFYFVSVLKNHIFPISTGIETLFSVIDFQKSHLSYLPKFHLVWHRVGDHGLD
jgi:hypothetical protein